MQHVLDRNRIHPWKMHWSGIFSIVQQSNYWKSILNIDTRTWSIHSIDITVLVLDVIVAPSSASLCCSWFNSHVNLLHVLTFYYIADRARLLLLSSSARDVNTGGPVPCANTERSHGSFGPQTKTLSGNGQVKITNNANFPCSSVICFSDIHFRDFVCYIFLQPIVCHLTVFL